MVNGIIMRVKVLLCFILLGVSDINAQSAGNIDTLSQWRVDSQMSNSYGVVYDHFKYFIDGDTVIGANEYYKVYKSGYSYEWEFSGYISDYNYYERSFRGVLRESDNKWYTSDIYNNDVLLYDFTVNIGDTICSGLITISDIDTIMVGGESKRRFHLFMIGVGGLADKIIEDVGATTGLFEPLVGGEFSSTMYCYAVDFTPLWINPNNYPDCDLSVRIDESIKNVNIICYPNPFTASSKIEYTLDKNSKIQISIYNAIGKVVYEVAETYVRPGRHEVSWSLGHLPAGLYYCVLRSEDGLSVVKIVKQ